MRKPASLHLSLAIAVSLTSATGFSFADSPKVIEKDLTDAFLTSISPAIRQAVVGYYGVIKPFDLFDAKINSLERTEEGGFHFKCQVIITTFEGAHNPPYGYDTVTLDVSTEGVNVINFEHQDHN